MSMIRPEFGVLHAQSFHRHEEPSICPELAACGMVPNDRAPGHAARITLTPSFLHGRQSGKHLRSRAR
jgi:hypothetical protein